MIESGITYELTGTPVQEQEEVVEEQEEEVEEVEEEVEKEEEKIKLDKFWFIPLSS